MNFQYRCFPGLPGPVPLALGVGVFDGVHLGHQKIMAELLRTAESLGALPVALTFDPHPRAVLPGQQPPPLLYPLTARTDLLRAFGAKAVDVVRFTPALAQLTPEEFIQMLTSDPRVKLRAICVGRNWRFGANGAGDVEELSRLAQKFGFLCSPVEQLHINGETVSSSAIRLAVASGLLEKARTMLGRHYSLHGTVEHGHRAAGAELGFPTANLTVPVGVLPPDGVYAGCAKLDGRVYPAAVNIGLSPTFDWQEHRRRIEAHLFDFSGDLYCRELEIALLRHLRPERTFAGPAELSAQIGRDIAQIKALFKRG